MLDIGFNVTAPKKASSGYEKVKAAFIRYKELHGNLAVSRVMACWWVL